MAVGGGGGGGWRDERENNEKPEATERPIPHDTNKHSLSSLVDSSGAHQHTYIQLKHVNELATNLRRRYFCQNNHRLSLKHSRDPWFMEETKTIQRPCDCTVLNLKTIITRRPILVGWCPW